MDTKISWTDKTWNPVHGCSKVSDGCRNCYAEALSLRRGWTRKPWGAQNAKENVMLKPHKLREPFSWKKPCMIFVNSMSDLFHEQIPDSYLKEVFNVMNSLPRHTFQILTKRPERCVSWHGPWTGNIWMGTSIEDSRVLYRLQALKQCNAAIRFISFEPLLGRIENVDLSGIHWVIVGGESGKGFRTMNHDWARKIRDLCIAQNIPFFFKQDSAIRTEMRPYLDGVVWHQYPPQLVGAEERKAIEMFAKQWNEGGQ
jgi:protein gp37